MKEKVYRNYFDDWNCRISCVEGGVNKNES